MNPLLLRALVVAVIAAIASGASWFVCSAVKDNDIKDLQLQLKGFELQVSEAKAKGYREGQAALQEEIKRADKLAETRAQELADATARADSQLRGVLRLCPRTPSGPMPTPGPGEAPTAGGEPSAAPGMVPGTLDPVGEVLDPEFIREALNKAEEVSTDLRTCLGVWDK